MGVRVRVFVVEGEPERVGETLGEWWGVGGVAYQQAAGLGDGRPAVHRVPRGGGPPVLTRGTRLRTGVVAWHLGGPAAQKLVILLSQSRC